MVFDEPGGSRLSGAASDVETAIRAAFPEISKQVVVNVFDQGGSARLVVSVKGGITDGDKLKLSNFLAEYGCSDPEETFSPDGDWVGMFDFKPSSRSRALRESAEEPVSVTIKVPGESDKEYWLGCSRRMQDLRSFDGGEVLRVFATDRYSKGMDMDSAGKLMRECDELVAEGQRFGVKRVYARGGRLVVEARRTEQDGEIICDFPTELLERLDGPCGLPRRDEEMFRSWMSHVGKISSYKVLGESRWCDEPAFGEPRECVKVLFRI